MSRIGIIIGSTRDKAVGKVLASGSMTWPRAVRTAWSTPCWISKNSIFRS